MGINDKVSLHLERILTFSQGVKAYRIVLDDGTPSRNAEAIQPMTPEERSKVISNELTENAKRLGDTLRQRFEQHRLAAVGSSQDE